MIFLQRVSRRLHSFLRSPGLPPSALRLMSQRLHVAALQHATHMNVAGNANPAHQLNGWTRGPPALSRFCLVFLQFTPGSCTAGKCQEAPRRRANPKDTVCTWTYICMDMLDAMDRHSPRHRGRRTSTRTPPPTLPTYQCRRSIDASEYRIPEFHINAYYLSVKRS